MKFSPCYVWLIAAFVFSTVSVMAQKSSKPFLWMENKGQIADTDGKLRPKILFTLQSNGVNVMLEGNKLHYQFQQTISPAGNIFDTSPSQHTKEELPEKTAIHKFSMELIGAQTPASIIKELESCYYENYYLPHCPEGILEVKGYEKITLPEIYPHIDWVLYVKDNQLKYDFVIKPGGSPADIRLQYEGTDQLYIQEDGNLRITTSLGTLTEQAPVSYQDNKPVNTAYILEDNQIRFSLGDYNPAQKLVIDPGLLWETYYGGMGMEGFRQIIVSTQSTEHVYGIGETNSFNAIATSNGFQDSLYAVRDVFLLKMDAAGNRVWATYYGGNSIEYGYGCATDPSGDHVYICGYTSSTDVIGWNGFQNTPDTGMEGFLAKFTAAGNRIWSTYSGGTGWDAAYALAVAPSGHIYLTGNTEATNNIATPGCHQPNLGSPGEEDAFLMKYNSNGTKLWGTYYGGALIDYGTFCSIGPNEDVYITGWTSSQDNIASGGHQNTYGMGSQDGFLAKFDSAGSRIWGTYYGGILDDNFNACYAANTGEVYATGSSSSPNAIAINGFQNTQGGQQDAIIVKFDANGNRIWGSYYGGNNTDYGQTITMNSAGELFICGQTRSANGIAFSGIQNTLGGDVDAFILKFDITGNRVWSTYYGHSLLEIAATCALNATGDLYVAGVISSNDTLPAGYQTTYGGGQTDGFLLKLSDPVLSVSSTGTKPSMLIYPNPGAGTYYLDCTEPGYIHISDVSGQEIMQKNIQPGEPVSFKASSGIYFIKIQSGSRTEISKIIHYSAE